MPCNTMKQPFPMEVEGGVEGWVLLGSFIENVDLLIPPVPEVQQQEQDWVSHAQKDSTEHSNLHIMKHTALQAN